MTEQTVQIIALSLFATGVIATIVYCCFNGEEPEKPQSPAPPPRQDHAPRTSTPRPQVNPTQVNPTPVNASELPRPRTRYGDESRAPVTPPSPSSGPAAPRPAPARPSAATEVVDRPAPRRPKLNLDDLLPVPKPKPPPKRPRRPKEEEHEEPTWPRGLHKPAKSWVNGLPKPSEKSLPFYEHSLRAAYACAWIDQTTDRSELNCIKSWTYFVQMHTGNNKALSERISEAGKAALEAGRISTTAALEHARQVSQHGSQTACRSVGNLCLAVATADKVLAPGEIGLVAGIWRQLGLSLAELRKTVERLIGSDDELSEAVANAELDEDLDTDDKLEALKRRLYMLNARLQNRQGDDLERDRQEIQSLVKVIQLYKEMGEHV